MTGDHPKSTPSIEPFDQRQSGGADELQRLGIVSHQHTSYHWGGYRYTNEADAIAAAKRASR